LEEGNTFGTADGLLVGATDGLEEGLIEGLTLGKTDEGSVCITHCPHDDDADDTRVPVVEL